MERCEECGEPVAGTDAVDVVGYGMPKRSGVLHEVCWENYKERLDSRPTGSGPEPRWQLKPTPGSP
jgi:hypothetical protein